MSDGPAASRHGVRANSSSSKRSPSPGGETAMEIVGVMLLVIIALGALYGALQSFRVVGQASVMVIERFGRFRFLAASGLNLIVPFMDKPRAVYWSGVRSALTTIDLREQLLEFPPQP